VTAAVAAPSRSRLLAFVALTKPRIIELLLVTTVPSMIVAESGLPSLWLMTATVVGGTLAAAGANAINMCVDRDIDRLMERTKNRPLVTGEVQPGEALAFAVALEVLAFVWLWGFVNLLSAVLAASATLFYVFVYTLWLKRTSTRNIVIGGAAGAVPVLVGWSAVTDSLGWPPIVLFGVMFFWTPPHFWALAIAKKDEYAKVGIPMLPVTHGNDLTRLFILLYTILLVLITLLPYSSGMSGLIYLVTAVTLSVTFVSYAIRLRKDTGTALAMRVFRYSIDYLMILFAALLIDHYFMIRVDF